jgi:hypothetical protein
MEQAKLTAPQKTFQFYTRVHLPELTGLKARNLSELAGHLKTVPGSVIYYHTHHFLKQHQYLNPEPPNDFAYWAGEALNDVRLAEKLASINACEFSTIRSLREQIIAAIEHHLSKAKRSEQDVNEGQEFHLIKSVSFIMQTPYSASTLEEFIAILRKVTVNSIYFHMFEARLRLEKGENDFSNWFETALGEKDLAKRISKLDPYTHTMEGLREKMIRLIEAAISQKAAQVRPGSGS